MVTIWRTLVLGTSFFAEQVRRIPGAGLVQRYALLVAALLVITALIAGSIWGLQKSPQRISMADLAVGALTPLQTWIIVSGDVVANGSGANSYHYTLTDPGVEGARLLIESDVPQPVGRTTISGRLIGGDARAPQGYDWVGHLDADPVLAQEQEPPWISIGLLLLVVVIALLVVTSYPVFFRDKPAHEVVSRKSLSVGVRRGWSAKAARVPGTLSIEPGKLVRLDVSDGESRELRLQSANSSIDVGRFQRLKGSEPVLRLVASGGDLALAFANDEDRDFAFNALAAAAAMPLRPQ